MLTELLVYCSKISRTLLKTQKNFQFLLQLLRRKRLWLWCMASSMYFSGTVCSSRCMHIITLIVSNVPSLDLFYVPVSRALLLNTHRGQCLVRAYTRQMGLTMLVAGTGRTRCNFSGRSSHNDQYTVCGIARTCSAAFSYAGPTTT